MKNNIFCLLLLFIIILSCYKELQNNKPHRRKEAEIDFYLNEEANSQTEFAVRVTFQNWGEKTHFNFNYKGRNKAGLIKDNKNTVSFLIEWPENISIKKAAWCQNWYDSQGNIIESDIIFNMQITNFTTLKTNTANSYYIEGVLAHEIGHMLGLTHIQSETSIMKPKSSALESYFKGKIDEETVNAYKELYEIAD